MEDPQLDSIFHLAFPGQNLKLVSNEIVKPTYKIMVQGKSIPVVDYDSTTNEIRFFYPGRFFGSVMMFKKHKEQEVDLYLLFRGAGLTADFKIIKTDDQWQVINRVFGKV
ncbi:hypothetical protein GCM10028803_21010 [Larkinella knui]|uniref:Uncharacterized protein n=1 Tax=Larkinella knui TaxID=2025310 RepID=A0A3P1CVL2_9BACT|nr:hypothetical protein [Larkinella knui]RRB17186.1 hypothetical protein EHT87_02580 [Larkinella knui]